MNGAERVLFSIYNVCIEDRSIESDLQVTKCDGTSGIGFHLRTHGKITRLPVNLSTMEPEHGGFKVKLMRNGNLLVRVPSYGFMENVGICSLIVSLKLMIFLSVAGAGKSIIWYDNLSLYCIRKFTLSASSAIIQDIRALQKSGLASIAFFYCDFRDDQKKGRHGLLSSLLVQLCEQSDAYSAIFSDFYVAHDRGSQHASDNELAECLKDMLMLPGQAAVHIIIDALDECPTTTGMPSPREEVLELVESLVVLHVPNLRICVTSRPETDIVSVLYPLVFRSVSLHGECGQIQDIVEYIKFKVRTDPKMRAWRVADKELVIDVLTSKADGM
jgi:hypothetical protein